MPRAGAPSAALPDHVYPLADRWAAEANPARQIAHLPSCPFPSLVATDSTRYGLASWFQPRAATYIRWKAERAVTSSGPLTSGLAGSSGLVSEEQAVRKLNERRMAANPRNDILRERWQAFEAVFSFAQRNAIRIFDETVKDSTSVRPPVFMASFLETTCIGLWLRQHSN